MNTEENRKPRVEQVTRGRKITQVTTGEKNVQVTRGEMREEGRSKSRAAEE